MVASREIRLKSRPVGMPTAENFELATVSVPNPAPGEVQIKNLWMTVDPYMRGRMIDRASYVPPFKLGEALQGGAIGEVAASNDPGFKPGDLVSTMFGWREAFNAPVGTLQKLDTFGLPPQAFLGVAGMPGLTAWVGLLKIAALKPGDVVFVSAAAGAVGSVVCQIAKIKGHTVIGSAGGADKGAFLKQIGVDHVIDYKTSGNLTEAVLQAAPKGIDVYFDNVGGRAPRGGAHGGEPLCPLCALRNDLAIQPRRPARGTAQSHIGGRQEPPAGGLHRLEPLQSFARVPKRHVGVDSRRQAHAEGNSRTRHRECADGLSQAVQG